LYYIAVTVIASVQKLLVTTSESVLDPDDPENQLPKFVFKSITEAIFANLCFPNETMLRA
jgi:hypothetical protein